MIEPNYLIVLDGATVTDDQTEPCAATVEHHGSERTARYVTAKSVIPPKSVTHDETGDDEPYYKIHLGVQNGGNAYVREQDVTNIIDLTEIPQNDLLNAIAGIRE